MTWNESPQRSGPGDRNFRVACDGRVNYTPVTVGAALLLFGGWYLLSAKKWFKGPIVQGTEEELKEIEREYETPAPASPTTAS